VRVGGISSRYIAEWMGQASTAITESVYIDLFPKDLEAHAALLGAAMRVARTSPKLLPLARSYSAM
jgi:hypothetical protein